MEENGFSLIWGQAMVMGMGSDRIIIAGDVGDKTLLELFDRLKRTAIQFFLFQVLEKALHHCVVIGMPLRGKRLHHPQFVDRLAEVRRGKPTTAIRVEQDALGYAPQPDGIPQGIHR